VASAEVRTETIQYSQSGSSTYLTVTIKSGYSVENSVALLDWLLRIAWSVNDRRVEQVVVITVVSITPNTIVDWDWSGAAKKLGFSDPNADNSRSDPILILLFDNEQMVKRYGPWPGQVPKAPANLFVKTG